MSEHRSIEDWLELSDFRESNPLDEKGKKRVRTNVKREIGWMPPHPPLLVIFSQPA
jgi:hypothetical protein